MVEVIVIVNSRCLQRPENRRCGNQLIWMLAPQQSSLHQRCFRNFRNLLSVQINQTKKILFMIFILGYAAVGRCDKLYFSFRSVIYHLHLANFLLHFNIQVHFPSLLIWITTAYRNKGKLEENDFCHISFSTVMSGPP